jgi:hypothetical protein
MRDAERSVRDDKDGRAVIRERDHDRPRFFDDSDRPRDLGGPIDFPTSICSGRTSRHTAPAMSAATLERGAS